MAELVSPVQRLQVAGVRRNLQAVRAQVERAAVSVGRDPAEVEILAAVKYVPAQELPVLAEAGVTLVGENRAQALVSKAADWGELFTWDFIGALQSKHVRAIVPHVRLIHSLASDSAARELERNLSRARPGLRVLVEVNLSNEPSKAGVVPAALDDFIARCPAPVAGLMTMPPLSADPQASRPLFRQLHDLAAERGLRELSMGTSQDFPVAVQEGATIVRIGTRLYS